MEQWRNDLYLSHHGILGMKWGKQNGPPYPLDRKRYSREELAAIRKEQTANINKIIKNDSRNEQLKKIEKQIVHLASTYDFDKDDGGGGTTKEDQKAGKKYIDLYDQYSKLEEQIAADAVKKAADKIVEKYGNVAVKQMKMQDNASAFAILSIIFALPIAAMWPALRTWFG